MIDDPSSSNPKHLILQALGLWGMFIIVNVIINGTIPFTLGSDMCSWVYSRTHIFLAGLIVYGVIFLTVPLILIKGWQTVRQPAFLIPLLIAIIAISLFDVFRGIAAISVFILAYLHKRFDLSECGIRSRGWKGDTAAVLLLAFLGVAPSLLRQPLSLSDPGQAVIVLLDRMFANPASTIENLFYFGFLTERLSYGTGKWFTPILMGLMYTVHEMTNPEYWYEGMQFTLVFVTVTVVAYVYIWRRSVIVIWLGDGLARFVRTLLG